MNVHFRRKTALFLTPVYFLTQVALGAVAESNIWADRRGGQPWNFFKQEILPLRRPGNLLADANLPLKLDADLLSYGSIRKIISPAAGKFGPTVLHIQDIHKNAEAQANIGKAIQGLVNNGCVDLIALEGAFEPVDLSVFRSFEYPNIVRKVADGLLAENKIAGPIHVALSSARPVPSIVGIDDRTHYDANVAAYESAAPLAAAAKENVRKDVRALEGTKARVFNKPLRAFDLQVSQYRAGAIKIGDFLRILSAQQMLPENSRRFLSALALESSLKFEAVEADRAGLLEALLPKLDPSQTNALVNRTAALRSGRMSPVVFYRGLGELCSVAGVPLKKFPALTRYIDYTLLAQKIDTEKLFSEIRTLEKTTYESLARSEDEERLIRASRQLYLTGKLLDFTLSKQEWGSYERTGVYAPFEAFYVEADIRDEKMAENLLAQSKGQTIVLVTGGFHSDGIDRRLADAGCTVVNFVPKITKGDVENGSAYLSSFTQQKTPLEKLFQGDKLFLAQEAFPSMIAKVAATRALLMSVAEGHSKEGRHSFAPAILAGQGLMATCGISKFALLLILGRSGLTIIRTGFAGQAPEHVEKISPHSFVYNGTLYIIALINFWFFDRGFRPNGAEDKNSLKFIGLVGVPFETAFILLVLSNHAYPLYLRAFLFFNFFLADLIISRSLNYSNGLSPILRTASFQRILLLSVYYLLMSSLVLFPLSDMSRTVFIIGLVSLPHLIIDAVLLWMPQFIEWVSHYPPLKEETVASTSRVEGTRRRNPGILLLGPGYSSQDKHERLPVRREAFESERAAVKAKLAELKAQVVALEAKVAEEEEKLDDEDNEAPSELEKIQTELDEKSLSVRDAKSNLRALERINAFSGRYAENFAEVMANLRIIDGAMWQRLNSVDKSQTVSVVAVAAPTRLLVANLFSSDFGWGFMDVDPWGGRKVVYLSLRRLGELSSKADFEMAAYTLATGVKLVDRYGMIQVHQSQNVYKEIGMFLAERKKGETPYRTFGFHWRHLRDCLFDKITLMQIRFQIRRDLNRLMNIGVFVDYENRHVSGKEIGRIVEDIASNPDNLLPHSNELRRAEYGEMVYREKRISADAIQVALIDLAQRSMAIGDYDVAGRIAYWSRLVLLFDSGLLPFVNFVSLQRILARMRLYPQLRQELINLNNGGTEVHVPLTWRRIRNAFESIRQRYYSRAWSTYRDGYVKPIAVLFFLWRTIKSLRQVPHMWRHFRERVYGRVVLRFNRSEFSLLTRAIEMSGLDPWLSGTLSAQSYMTPNPSDRKTMILVRHEATTLVRQYLASRVIHEILTEIKLDENFERYAGMARDLLNQLNSMSDTIYPQFRELAGPVVRATMFELFSRVAETEPALAQEGLVLLADRELLPPRPFASQLLEKKIWAMHYKRVAADTQSQAILGQLLTAARQVVLAKGHESWRSMTLAEVESEVDAQVILRSHFPALKIVLRQDLAIPEFFFGRSDYFELAHRAAYGRYVRGLSLLEQEDLHNGLAYSWWRFLTWFRSEMERHPEWQRFAGNDPWYLSNHYVPWEAIRFWFARFERQLSAEALRLVRNHGLYLDFVRNMEPFHRSIEKAIAEIEAEIRSPLRLPERVIVTSSIRPLTGTETHRVLPGSTTGRFILDPLHEWRFFLIGPLASVAVGFFSPNLLTALIVGIVLNMLTFHAARRFFVNAHGPRALASANVVRLRQGKKTLSETEYPVALRRIYFQLGMTAMLAFFIISLTLNMFLGQPSPTVILAWTLLATFGVYTLHHLGHNLAFLFGWEEIPGSTGGISFAGTVLAAILKTVEIQTRQEDIRSLGGNWHIQLLAELTAEQQRRLGNFFFPSQKKEEGGRTYGIVYYSSTPYFIFSTRGGATEGFMLLNPMADGAENTDFSKTLEHIWSFKFNFPSRLHLNFLISHPYSPEEPYVVYDGVHRDDQFEAVMFRQGIRPEPGSSVLDMGSGHGLNGVWAASKGAAEIVASDLFIRELANTRQNLERHVKIPFQVVHSDLFSGIPKGKKFKQIYFDPPVMPIRSSAGLSDPRIFDPEMKLMDRFLSEAGDYLDDGGTIEVAYPEIPEIFDAVYRYGYRPIIIEGADFTRDVLTDQNKSIEFDYSRITLVRAAPDADLKSLQDEWAALSKLSTYLRASSILWTNQMKQLLALIRSARDRLLMSDNFDETLFLKVADNILMAATGKVTLPGIPAFRVNNDFREHSAVRRIPGSSTGRFIFDTFYEARFFFIGPVGSISTAVLFSIFGFTGPPHQLLLISLAVGAILHAATVGLMRSWFVRAHGLRALGAVNAVLRRFNQPEISLPDYHEKLHPIFNKLSRFSFPLFVASTLALKFFSPAADPVNILLGALLLALTLHELRHVVNNAFFKFGHFNIAPVLASQKNSLDVLAEKEPSVRAIQSLRKSESTKVISDITRLSAKLAGKFHVTAYTHVDIEAMVAADRDGLSQVMFDGNENLVGFLLAKPYDGRSDAAYINWTGADDDFRGKGVFRAMLKEFAKKAAEKKMTFAVLRVRDGNPGARAVYRHYGFISIGRIETADYQGSLNIVPVSHLMGVALDDPFILNFPGVGEGNVKLALTGTGTLGVYVGGQFKCGYHTVTDVFPFEGSFYLRFVANEGDSPGFSVIGPRGGGVRLNRMALLKLPNLVKRGIAFDDEMEIVGEGRSSILLFRTLQYQVALVPQENDFYDIYVSPIDDLEPGQVFISDEADYKGYIHGNSIQVNDSRRAEMPWLAPFLEQELSLSPLAKGIAALWPLEQGDLNEDLLGLGHSGIQLMTLDQINGLAAHLSAMALSYSNLAKAQQDLMDLDHLYYISPSAKIEAKDAFVFIPGNRLPELHSIIEGASARAMTVIAARSSDSEYIKQEIRLAGKNDYISVVSAPKGFLTVSGRMDIGLVIAQMENAGIAWKNAFIGRPEGVGFDLPSVAGFDQRVYVISLEDLLLRTLSGPIYGLGYLRIIDKLARATAASA